MNRRRNVLVRNLVLFVFTVVLWWHAVDASEQSPPPTFFTSYSLPGSPKIIADIGVTRSRQVLLDRTILENAQPGTEFQAMFFNDTKLNMSIDRVKVRDDGRTVFFGHVHDDEHSSITLVLHEGLVTGRIQSLQHGTYKIVPYQKGTHLVHQIDHNKLPTCGDCPVIEHDEVDEGIAGGTNCDNGTVIDVLVLYTPLVTNRVGGHTNAANLIILAEELTNEAYSLSHIHTRINMIHYAETNYNEDGLYQDHLDRLRAPGDGVMDEVHPLRAQHRADMVALLVTDTTFCGLAYLMQNPSSSFAPNAFSVTTYSCIYGDTFAHELGHNMGCSHDHAAGAPFGMPAYEYSFAYRFTGTSGTLWRTIMSYTPGTRIKHFSNPNVLYDGAATGVDDLADCARTINNTKIFTANFQCSLNPDDPIPCTPLSKNFAGHYDFFSRFAHDVHAHTSTNNQQYAIVGEPDADNQRGAATIFHKQNDNWIINQRLTDSTRTIGDHFANAVRIQTLNQDSILAFAGTPGKNDAGAVNVFQNDPIIPDLWNHIATITPSDLNTNDDFGESIDVSGQFLIVGSPLHDLDAMDGGAAYIFQRNQTDPANWTQNAKLTPPTSGVFDAFGSSVSIHAHPAGSAYALVGAPADDTAAFDAGAAYLFEYDGTWNFVKTLTASDALAGDRFGSDVEISAHAGGALAAIVGAPQADIDGNLDEGAAYIFARNLGGADQWGEEAKLTAESTASPLNFGQSVALDYGTAIIGAPATSDLGANAGAAHLFRHEPGGVTPWVEFHQYFPTVAPMSDDEFGSAVAVTNGTVIFGAPGDTDGAEPFNPFGEFGAAYIVSGMTDMNANDVPDSCDPLPLNDSCTSAFVVGAGAHPFDTFNATSDGFNEPNDCAGVTETFEGDVWYRFIILCDGTATAMICDAEFDAKLAVYGASCPSGPGELIACGDNECGNGPVASFPVASAVVNRIRIGRVDAESGSGTLFLHFSNGCLGDIHPSPCGNGVVNVNDILRLIGEWGATMSHADLNLDQIVNVNDLLSQIGSWGPCP